MMVILPCRLAGRKTVRPVSSEYRSKIWSTGALKNLRKCSARSDCPSAVALVAADSVGLPGVGGAAWPATAAFGLMLGGAFVAAPGTGSAGKANTFVRVGRSGALGSALTRAPGRLVGSTVRFVAAGLSAPARELVTRTVSLVALAVSLVDRKSVV